MFIFTIINVYILINRYCVSHVYVIFTYYVNVIKLSGYAAMYIIIIIYIYICVCDYACVYIRSPIHRHSLIY